MSEDSFLQYVHNTIYSLLRDHFKLIARNSIVVKKSHDSDNILARYVLVDKSKHDMIV